MNPIIEMSESVDINTISTNNVSDNISLNYGQNQNNLGGNSTPVTTPEPKSVSNPSGSRSEIHYPGVQNPSRIYDSKRNKKIVRIMTVMAYMFAVSLAAIVLSIYYAFLWNPNMQINNSTHLYSKKTNIKPEVVPLIEEADIDAIESNQVQTQVLSNDQPIASSAQLLTPSDNLSDSQITTRSSMSPTISPETNGRNSVYSSNSSLSLNLEKQNASKHLISKTFTPNVEKIVSNKNNEREEKTTKILDETNRTEINTIVDNQIEISLNTSQTQN